MIEGLRRLVRGHAPERSPLEREIAFVYSQLTHLDRRLPYRPFLAPQGLWGDGLKTLMARARQMLHHVGLDPRDVLVTYASQPGRAGCMEGRARGDEFFVEIDPAFSRSRAAVEAILAHEVAHVWKAKIGFVDSDNRADERYTDIAAVLLGFGDQVLKGNHARVEVGRDYDGDRAVIHYATPTSYLSSEDLAYCWACSTARLDGWKDRMTFLWSLAPMMPRIRAGCGYLSRSRRYRRIPIEGARIFACGFCFSKFRIRDAAGRIRVRCRRCLGEAILAPTGG